MARSRVRAHLYTEGGRHKGLPNIDAASLSAHALLRICGVRYAVTAGASRSLTSAGTLPVVIFDTPTGPSTAAGLPPLIEALSSDDSLPSPNAHLTPFMSAESSAFCALVSASIDPARRHELFVDEANHADVARALAPAGLSWPLSAIVPAVQRRETVRSLAGREASSLFADAERAIAALATRLGGSKFFYGAKPSALDAVVFGQLAAALVVPLPRARLRPIVAQHANLVAFVNRVRDAFFAEEADDWEGAVDCEEAAALAREEAERRAVEESTRKAAEEKEREAREGRPPPSSETPEETEQKQGNVYFVWTAVAVFAAHMLLSNEIEFSLQ